MRKYFPLYNLKRFEEVSLKTWLDMIYFVAEIFKGFARIEYQRRIQNPDNYPQLNLLQKVLKPLTIFVKYSILNILYVRFLTFEVLKLWCDFQFMIILK